MFTHLVFGLCAFVIETPPDRVSFRFTAVDYPAVGIGIVDRGVWSACLRSWQVESTAMTRRELTVTLLAAVIGAAALSVAFAMVRQSCWPDLNWRRRHDNRAIVAPDRLPSRNVILVKKFLIHLSAVENSM
jgi:hypothetical protein